MRKINRALKIRIYPTAEQRVQIEQSAAAGLSITVCLRIILYNKRSEWKYLSGGEISETA